MPDNILIDIESMEYQWQKDLLKGFKAGTMNYISAGRQTGKSYVTQILKSRYYGKPVDIFNQNLCNEIMLPDKPKSKYQFSRTKWYQAKRPGGWNVFGPEYDEVLQWCEQTFGPHPKNRDAWSRWYMGMGTVVFRDEKDYNWFILRWGVNE